MKAPGGAIRDRRVLVLAPTPNDATIAVALLAGAAVSAHACADLASLSAEYQHGAGAILLTEEALDQADAGALVAVLAQQPSWSDIPVLLLAQQGADSPLAREAMSLLGNVTILERPVRTLTLLSAIRSALRGRDRQYQRRRHEEELRRSEVALRKQAKQLALAQEIGRIGSFEWDLADEVHWSDEMKEIFGIPAPAPRSPRGWGREIVDEADRARVEAEIQDQVARGGEHVSEFRIRPGGTGPIRWIEARTRIECDAGGRPCRMFGVVMDITARKETEVLLREADRRKDEFIAVLAHEIRNPLAPMRTAVELLGASDLSGRDLATGRDVIRRQVEHMSRLVDDLLDLSRITRGKIVLRRERVDLSTVVESALETSRPHLEAGDHELTVTLPPAAVFLDADAVRLAQVFSNLLNNAARYSERGSGIRLSAANEKDDVVVAVADEGIGIPEEMLSRIFDMFAQVDTSHGRSPGGLGIGLTVVKQLVEMHGGTVEARSGGLAKGSEFLVRLPRCLDARDAAKPDAAPVAAGEKRAPLRVLVVDDNEDAAETLALMLRREGDETRTAHDGREALAIARAFHPEVVLLDIGLPAMNGYDVARALRRESWGQSARLVAITGWGQDDDRRRSAEAGFDAHLVKPVAPVTLKQLLASLPRDQEPQAAR